MDFQEYLEHELNIPKAAALKQSHPIGNSSKVANKGSNKALNYSTSNESQN